MAKKDVNPDALASKTFAVTILGALLYITVVFVFVIFGNRKDEEPDGSLKAPEVSAAFPAEVQHHD